MISINNSSTTEKELLRLFRVLGQADQETLLRFAAFLAASPARQTVVAEPAVTVPVVIPRPEQESVIKAIKRLRDTYPMLNPDKLLTQTSDLMSAHVIKGQPAAEIIDQLERVFAEHYQQFKNVLTNS